MGVVKDLKNLIKGLGITGKHLGKHAVTLQYPTEKMEMPERSRGVVVLLSDKETGELNCTACELCMRACPTGAIQIESHRDENKKKVLDKFVVDNALCCYCGLCEEACNFSAIKLATKYEFSTLDINDTIWDVKKLQEVGRDVPYEDTRKKKKAAKPQPKPAPKPAADKAADKPGEEATDKASDEKPVKAEESAKPTETDKPAEDKVGADEEQKPKPGPDGSEPAEDDRKLDENDETKKGDE